MPPLSHVPATPQAMEAERAEIQEAAKKEAARDIMSYPVVQSVVSRANRFLPYLQSRIARQQKEDRVRCCGARAGGHHLRP